MAITRVRVKFNGAWTTLSYNSATAHYEGTITPTSTSIYQSGGYYNLEAEVTNSTGQTSTLTGTDFPSLRLVVREQISPSLTPVSPPPGYLNTLRPTVVMDAADEAGGSGINPGSFSVTVDGEPFPGTSATAVSGGYRLSFTPEADLSEGPHEIVFFVSDRDGNQASAAVAYVLDVTPPELELTAPDSHRVVDWAEEGISGLTADAISGPPAVTIRVNGTVRASPAVGDDGRFFAEIPLEIGVNEILVTAIDGSGLSSARSFVMIRLVTDRTEADVERLQSLFRRGVSNWTEEERTWFATTRCRRGAYDVLDLNRVTAAMEFLDAWMSAYGNDSGYSSARPGTWLPGDGVETRQRDRYIANIAGIRDVFILPEGTAETPEGWNTIPSANAIESILVAVDALRPLLERSPFVSDEIMCGEE
ncbi:MAG: hypothetical protein HFG05_03890 [Oscillibacter sp.]|nr:hypothetical protein [Oscillibacter sp.]